MSRNLFNCFEALQTVYYRSDLGKELAYAEPNIDKTINMRLLVRKFFADYRYIFILRLVKIVIDKDINRDIALETT